MAKMEAILSEYRALLLNNEGYVTEATGDNVFIVKNGVLITPPPFVGLLEGITRNTVMELSREKGIDVQEKLFNRLDVYVADECFLTGTAAELIPVVSVDGRQIGNGQPGPMTNDLIKAYRELTKVNGPLIKNS